MAANDGFDDLFTSSSSSSSTGAAAGMPSFVDTAGFGGFDEDATSNPFADLQSSRVMMASTYSSQEDSGEGASLDRRLDTLTIDTNASNQAPSDTHARSQSTTSSSSNKTGNDAASASAAAPSPSTADTAGFPSYSPSANTVRSFNDDSGDRVLVSPFDPSSAAATPFGVPSSSGLREDQDPMNSLYSSHTSHDPYSGSSSTAAAYDDREQSPFDSTPYDSSAPSPPSLRVDEVGEGDDHGGFASQGASPAKGDRHTDSLRSSQNATPTTERADAASIKTVGLESDAASMRSGQVGL